MNNPTSNPHIVWVITDTRPGNNSQVYGVAKCLSKDYQEINISYNSLIKLPNMIIGSSLKALDSQSKTLIKQMLLNVVNKKIPIPNYIIGAGRRSACISSYMKKYLKKNLHVNVKNCHIMHPNLNFSLFDLVVLFQHDNNKHINDTNVIEVLSSPNIIDNEIMCEYKNLWQEKFNAYDSPIIGVLMGGSTKNRKFTSQDITSLISKINTEAKRINASVFITTSRRTPTQAIDLLKENITQPTYIYEWTPTNHDQNPYKGILALSDYIVVTGDSVSMCSEACATNAKGVYIYSNTNIASEKHILMHKNIFQEDLARDFLTHKIESWPRKIYNSSLEIAKKL